MPKISYAASSALAKQIEQGAPADLFISADTDWMDYVDKKDLIKTDTRVNLLGNKIVLIAPRDSKATVDVKQGFDLAKALAGGKLAMANVDAVPAGKYGKAALEKLGAWDGVKDKIAQAENVRAALLLVARGEAALGIVYSTDAAAEPNVKIVGTFPADSHPPIIYPAAVTKDAKSADAKAVPRPAEEQQGAAGLREAGVHGAGEVRQLDMTAEEWTAVRLSLLVAVTAMAASLPLGIAIAWLLARGRFWGKSLVDTLVHLPLIMPPVVTGYLLLILFGRRGPIGEFLDAVRHRLRLPLDRRGARLRGDGLPADGARHPALDRGGRHAAGERGRHAGRQPALGVRHHHPAALPAGRDRGRDPVLRQVDGRVRRDHHLRLQHPGRDPDPALGDLHLHPGAGRRCRRAAADRWCRSRSRWSALLGSELLARRIGARRVAT